MEFTRTILEIIEVFFVSYLIGYAIILMSSIILGSVSIYERKRKKELNNIINYDKDLKISIIVPAYNEEITIIETIESLVNVNYKDYEIIIVDDESEDNT